AAPEPAAIARAQWWTRRRPDVELGRHAGNPPAITNPHQRVADKRGIETAVIKPLVRHWRLPLREIPASASSDLRAAVHRSARRLPRPTPTRPHDTTVAGAGAGRAHPPGRIERLQLMPAPEFGRRCQ